MRSLTACLVLLTASGCIHSMECTAHGGPTWYEVKSPHFELKTNKSLEVATKDVELLEKLHFVMRWLFDIETDVDDPLTVISVTNSADLYAFVIDAAGLAVTSGPRRFLILSGDSMSSKRGESAELYAHELAHLASRNAMPLQPHWLSEGFAEYAGPTLFLAAATVKVGLMPKRAVEVAGVASVEQLWAWSYDSMSDAQRGWFYFSAWAWVHYLFNNEAERFRAFIERTKEGGEVRQLFEHAFSAQWQAETKIKIDQYVRKGTYYSTTLRVPTPQLALKTRALSDAEVHLIRGALFDNPTRPLPTTVRESVVAKETETARSLHSPLTEPLWEVLPTRTQR